ncbi:MAG TPA: citrate synthase [Actinocatenispora sp.]
MSDEPRWLSTAQTAQLLGVKPATVYAYVSRGQLTRHPGAEPRTSRFDRAEVLRLAARARRGGRAGALDVVLDTELSLLDPAGALYYRGRDATRLAGTAGFERVAEFLWSGRMPDETPVWTAPAEAVTAGRAARHALPATAGPADRFRVTAAVVATTDPLRYDRRPDAVAATARALVAALVDCLPRRTEPVDDTIAARLWAASSDRAPTPAELRAFDAGLVLSADHELATSALASRVAASVQADPYLTVLAGLATLGGALHGGVVGAVETVLAELTAGGRDVPRVVGERLAAGEAVPGFGHQVYTATDPRAVALLRLVADAAGGPPLDGRVDELIAVVGRHGGPAPTSDLALGVLAAQFGLAPGTAEAVFVLGRVAGLIGHTIEEYRHRFRFRPRAVYTGPRP